MGDLSTIVTVIINVGDVVEWDSQAGGSWIRKRGTVKGFVPKGERIGDKFPDAYINSHKISCDVSRTMNRAVVEVTMKSDPMGDNRKAKMRRCKPEYYAPNVKGLMKIG
jgi:hypothetical protein